ncbi:MAG: type II toxin-antitoxin system RelE/ParE family toxin [Bacteroidetes bacterium]|nr:type II toxin-antitoxin system RelE/ParE family toxin [Bacteroidota bacterium]
MSRYSIVLSKTACKNLDKLDNQSIKPILAAISKLAVDPRPHGCKKLVNRAGYRIRVGDYRIIYDIIDSELIIDVITLGHRKDIYEQ